MAWYDLDGRFEYWRNDSSTGHNYELVDTFHRTKVPQIIL